MENKEEKEEQKVEELKQEEVKETNETMTPVEEKKEEEEKKKKSKAPLIIILLLIIIAVVGVILFVLPKLKAKPTKEGIDKTSVKSYRLEGNGLDDFDLYFLQAENNGKNRVYSPLSIKYALAMLNEGTAGDSHKQIADVIGEYKAKKYPNNEHMSFANAMFIKETFKDQIKADYTKSLKDKYNAEVMTDSFKTPDTINNWVSDRTFKLVNNLVDDASRNNFFLINALAIDMNWNYEIHCATGSQDRVPCFDAMYSVVYHHEKVDDNAELPYHNTSYPYDTESQFYHLKFNGQEKTKAAEILGDFNRYDIVKELGEDNIRKTVGEEYKKWLETEEGKSWVEGGYGDPDVNKFLDGYIKELNSNYGTAKHSTDFMFYTDDNVKVFAKDLKEYDGTTLQYVGIMPVKEDLNKFVENVKAEDLNNYIKNLKEPKIENFKDGVATIISGDIPLFKYEYQLDLMNDLQEIGITDIFDSDKADLSNIVKSKGNYIDKAIHKANIEFSNEGIKAAAASAMGGAGATGGGFEYLYKIPVERIDLTFDKPYMYLIRDKSSGEVWFVGSVYEPIKQ